VQDAEPAHRRERAVGDQVEQGNPYLGIDRRRLIRLRGGRRRLRSE
jgi:hypothetical protein